MLKPKFEIGQEVILNETHENYFALFPAGRKYKVTAIEVTYRIEDEQGNPVGHIDEHELEGL